MRLVKDFEKLDELIKRIDVSKFFGADLVDENNRVNGTAYQQFGETIDVKIADNLQSRIEKELKILGRRAQTMATGRRLLVRPLKEFAKSTKSYIGVRYEVVGSFLVSVRLPLDARAEFISVSYCFLEAVL